MHLKSGLVKEEVLDGSGLIIEGATIQRDYNFTSSDIFNKYSYAKVHLDMTANRILSEGPVGTMS